MQADSPVADEAADSRTDESYGPEYCSVPIEREHSLYHPSPLPSPVPVPSRWRDVPEDYSWERRQPRPFICGNAYREHAEALRWQAFERRNNALRHGGGNGGRRSMANTTPRATPAAMAWRAGSGLTDDEFKVAMKTLKKQAYTPSSGQQKSAFRRLVSGVFQTQKTANNAQEEEKACTICLETFRRKEEVVVTPCNHMFHQGCVAPWVKEQGNCPVCRFVLRNRGKVVVDDDDEDASPGWV